jgi:hypothetical protein
MAMTMAVAELPDDVDALKATIVVLERPTRHGR